MTNINLLFKKNLIINYKLIKLLFYFSLSIIFLSSCFEDEVPSSSSSTTNQATDLQGLNPDEGIHGIRFPLDERNELEFLNNSYRSNCIGNIECSMSELDRLADDFSFRSGKLIVRGNLVHFNQQTNLWSIVPQLEIISLTPNAEQLFQQQESDYHQYISELRPYYHLASGINMNLDMPVRPVIVSQGKLGLEERQSGDPGLCDVIAAENFERLSQPPWPKYNHGNLPSSDYTWPIGTGIFNENNDVFAAETIIVCGEINILNRTLKLEAKNIIFYNSHLKVMSDRDMPSGIRITAENIGYFGANLIESNMVNRISGQRNADAPTIDIGASGVMIQVPSSAPINNRFNAHYFRIFMAENL